MRAIQITEFGGPEVLRVVELPDPEPAEGLVPHEVTAAGINYADTHQVEDSYLASPTLPLVPGSEFVGLGPEGRRVVGLLPVYGGYAERVLAVPQLTWPVPEGVSDGAALAMLVQGLTAWHTLRTCAHLGTGESVVVQAAAGGVGTVAVQLAKAWGAGRVIALASSDEKRELARSLGADATVDSATPELRDALLDANEGRKVDVVLEMTGGPVFEACLRSLAPFGRTVVYGQASRQPFPAVDPEALIRHSSTVIGFWLLHCAGRPEMVDEPLGELLAMVADGRLRAVVGGTYPLAEAERAHRDLLARGTVGKLVLDPRR